MLSALIAYMAVKAPNCINVMTPLLIAACSVRRATRYSSALLAIDNIDIRLHDRVTTDLYWI